MLSGWTWAHLNEGHVDTVNIRSLLTVYFNAHKVLIEKCSNLFTLKRLSLHHMTPMAGGVPHGEEDGFVLLPCLLKSFLTPRIPDGESGCSSTTYWLCFIELHTSLPVNRIRSMLQKVRWLLISQPIASFLLFWWWTATINTSHCATTGDYWTYKQQRIGGIAFIKGGLL